MSRSKKDGFSVRTGKDDFSRMKSIMAQVSHAIDEKRRIAREEEAKKRADKKKKPLESEVVS